jgi:hypothetical protein
MNTEEKEYQKLSKMGQSLGVIIPECFLEIEVKLTSGEVCSHYKQRSHSWVRNAYNLMMTQLGAINASDVTFGAGLMSEKKVDSGILGMANQMVLDQPLNVETDPTGYRSASGNAGYGIVVGSSIQAESFENSILITPIANGVGAGQLSYNLAEVPVKSYDVPSLTYSVAHVRYINNNSGGNVLVNEVALIARGVSYGPFLMSRDHLLATVTIPSTGQLKVTYTISLVYPA